MYSACVKMLALVGIVTVGILLLAFIFIFYMWLREYLNDRYLRNQYKHRYDRKPIAKCYCIDCKWYKKETNLCHNKYCNVFPEDHFCKDAEPNKYNKYAPLPKEAKKT